MRKGVQTLFLMLLSTLLPACGSKPVDQIVETEQKIESLEGAQASLYAPSEYEAAMSAWQAARDEIDAQSEKSFLTRSYARALELLQEASAKAEAALNAASANREKTRQEIQALEEELTQSIEELKEALGRARGRRNVIRELRGELEEIEKALQEATSLGARLNPVQTLEQLKALKQRADQFRQEMGQRVRL